MKTSNLTPPSSTEWPIAYTATQAVNILAITTKDACMKMHNQIQIACMKLLLFIYLIRLIS